MGWWVQALSWKVDSQVHGEGGTGLRMGEGGVKRKKRTLNSCPGSEPVFHQGALDTNKEERTGHRLIKAKITSQ